MLRECMYIRVVLRAQDVRSRVRARIGEATPTGFWDSHARARDFTRSWKFRLRVFRIMYNITVWRHTDKGGSDVARSQ